MTITLSPDQAQAVRDAIPAGQVASVEELIERAIAGLPKGDESPAASSSAGRSSVSEQDFPLNDTTLLRNLREVVREYLERNRKKSINWRDP